MTILEAQDILTLVQNAWSIIPRVSGQGGITNGGFESGNTNGFSGTGITAVTAEHHTGSYSCKIDGENGELTFSRDINLPVNLITSFSFWFKGHFGDFTCSPSSYIEYTDNTKTYFVLGFTAFWTSLDLLSILTEGKTVKNIHIFCLAYNNSGYIDDVLLTFTGNDVLLQLDEYNPLHPDYQIVFINNPERIMFVAPNVIRHEQDVRIELHTKLVHYDPTDIENSYRPTILAMKEELTRIFNANRYDSVGNTLNHSSWRDSKFPHGFGTDAEPISFVSRMTVQIHYYEAVDGDDTAIGLRPSEIEIMGEDLLGVTEINWDEVDPWVPLQVPKGTLKEQHLLGPHVDGTIVCHDYKSLYTCLYTIPIVPNGNQYPINQDMTKIKFSTDIPSNPQFVVTMRDVLGNTYTHSFFNVRIKKIELQRANTSGLVPMSWVIHWMSDYIYTTPPT